MPTLEESITKAVKDTPLPQDLSEVVPPVKEPIRRVEPDDEPLEVEEDQDTVQGRTLIRALKNPDQAGIVIDALAKMAGYTKGTIETNQDVNNAKRDLKSLLEKHLGDEFKFLAPKIGPALEEYLQDLRPQQADSSDTDNLRERLDRTEFNSIQGETARAHEELAQEYFGSSNFPNNVTNAMSRAMDEFPPNNPDMSPRTYYRKIFSLVAGELGLSRRGGQRNTRNVSDAPARQLSSTNRGITPSSTGNARKLSLEQAVKLAVQQVDKASR